MRGKEVERERKHSTQVFLSPEATEVSRRPRRSPERHTQQPPWGRGGGPLLFGVGGITGPGNSATWGRLSGFKSTDKEILQCTFSMWALGWGFVTLEFNGLNPSLSQK